MRKIYSKIFKKFFTEKLIQQRDKLGITQEEMSYLLQMSGRAYVNLEHEKFGCGGLTLALYLIYIDPDPITFLKELRETLEEENPEEKKAV